MQLFYRVMVCTLICLVSMRRIKSNTVADIAAVVVLQQLLEECDVKREHSKAGGAGQEELVFVPGFDLTALTKKMQQIGDRKFFEDEFVRGITDEAALKKRLVRDCSLMSQSSSSGEKIPMAVAMLDTKSKQFGQLDELAQEQITRFNNLTYPSFLRDWHTARRKRLRSSSDIYGDAWSFLNVSCSHQDIFVGASESPVSAECTSVRQAVQAAMTEENLWEILARDLFKKVEVYDPVSGDHISLIDAKSILRDGDQINQFDDPSQSAINGFNQFVMDTWSSVQKHKQASELSSKMVTLTTQGKKVIEQYTDLLNDYSFNPRYDDTIAPLLVHNTSEALHAFILGKITVQQGGKERAMTKGDLERGELAKYSSSSGFSSALYRFDTMSIIEKLRLKFIVKGKSWNNTQAFTELVARLSKIKDIADLMPEDREKLKGAVSVCDLMCRYLADFYIFDPVVQAYTACTTEPCSIELDGSTIKINNHTMKEFSDSASSGLKQIHYACNRIYFLNKSSLA